MLRHLLPALLLALVCVVLGTHELCAHVLAFDWTAVSAAPDAAAPTVQLP